MHLSTEGVKIKEIHSSYLQVAISLLKETLTLIVL